MTATEKSSLFWILFIGIGGFALLIFTSSCDDNVTISKTEYQKLKGDTVKSKYPKPFKLQDEGLGYDRPSGIVLGSDNHEYLVIWYNSNACNVEHYIDCELCESRDPLK